MNKNDMAKVTIEFDSYEEREEMIQAIKASDYHSLVWEFSQHLRNKLKYEEMTEEEDAIVEEIREVFIELLNENNIVL